MRIFGTHNNKLMIGSIIIIAISLLLLVVVCSYYSQKLRQLEEQQFSQVTIVDIREKKSNT